MHTTSSSRTLRRLERISAIVALPLAALMVPLPVVAQTAPVVVAPNSGNTKAYLTPTGVAVVDVNTANAAGLSHNKFTHYNVPTQGLVLNNSVPTQFTYPSQLAGSVTVNFNTKDAAKVILNEVVAPNATTIAGFTEIVGGKADLLVANPYGIAVKGGGFINTDRVTLATGEPMIGPDGTLTGLRVVRGELSISGDGLNAANVGLVDLLARTVKIEGQVNAQDLLVGAGVNDFDYASRQLAANQATDAAPTHAVDSSVIGGMYANRIRLVATEAGVGVRMLGDAAALADDLTIDAAGRVQLSNKLSAERDVRVAGAGGVEASGAASSLSARRDLTLDAKTSDISLSDGSLIAGHDLTIAGGSLVDTSTTAPSSANRFAIGTVTVATTGDAKVSASAYGAGSAFRAETGSAQFANGARFYSGADANAADRSLTIQAHAGDLDTGDAEISSPAALSLTAHQGNVRIDVNRGTGIEAATNLTIVALNGVSNAGQVTAGESLHIRSAPGSTAATVTNQGSLVAGAGLTVDSEGSPVITYRNVTGGIVGAQTVAIDAASLSNAGTIQGTRSLSLRTAGALSNEANALLLTATETGRNVTLEAGSFSNAGIVQSLGALTVTVAGDARNSGSLGTLGATDGGTDGQVTFTADTLDNSGTIQSASTLDVTTNASVGVSLANSGKLQAMDRAALTVGARFANAATGQVLAGSAISIQSGTGAFVVSNAGRLQAAQDLTIGVDSARVSYQQSADAVTLSAAAMQLHASSVENSGVLQAGDTLTIDAMGAFTNQVGGGVLTSGTPGKTVNLTVGSLTNAGQIQSTGSIVADVAGAANNSGTLLTLAADAAGANGDFSLRGDSLNNSGKIIVAGAVGIDVARNFQNHENAAIVAARSLEVTASALRNDGALLAEGALALRTGSTLANAGLIQSLGDLSLVAPQLLTNATSAQILSGANLRLISDAGAWTLSNAGRIQSTGNLSLGAANAIAAFQNQSTGIVFSSEALAIHASDLTNDGVIRGETEATFAVDGTFTNRHIVATDGHAGARLSIVSEIFANSGSGQIVSDGLIDVAAAGAFDNAGTLLTQAANEGGSAEGISTRSSTFNNSGTFQSAGELEIAAQDKSSTSFANSGRLQAVNSISIVAPNRQEVTSTGVMLSGKNITLRSGDGSWSLVNAGTINARHNIQIGSFGEAVALSNSKGAAIVADKTLNVTASTIGNAGTLQGDFRVDLDASDIVSNASTGVIAAVAPGAQLSLGASDLENRGSIESSGNAAIGVVHTTTNYGVIAAHSGRLSLISQQLDNSNVISAGSHVDIQTRGTEGTTLNNSGDIVSGDAISISTQNGLENRGAISGHGFVTVRSGNAASFNLNNSGLVQGGAVMLGTGDERATFLNNGNVTSTNSLVVHATTLSNYGDLQAGTSLTTDATGNIANDGKILGAQAVTLSASALNNASTIAAGTIDPNGDVVTVGNLAITTHGASPVTLTNTGHLTATGTVDLTVNHGLTNASNATIKGLGNVTVGAGVDGAFSVTNNGTIQSATDLTIGTTARPATLVNHAAAFLLAGRNLAIEATTLTNAGTIQGAGAVNLNATGALTNDASGNIFATGGATANISAVAASISNAGAIQSSGAITANTPGLTTNSGKWLTGANGAMDLTTSSLTNTGVMESGGSLNFVAGANITNAATARIQAAGNLNLTTPQTLSNQGEILGGANMVVTGGSTAFNIINDGRMQSAQNFTFGGAGARAVVANNATGVMQSGGAMSGHATTFTNANLIQSGAAFTLDASGALTNAVAAKLMAVGDSASAMHVAAASVTNAGIVQAEGSGSFTIGSGATFTNELGGEFLMGEGLTISTSSGNFTLNNSGLIQSGGLLTLGGGARHVTLNQIGTGSKLFGGSFAITADAVVNQGMIMGMEGGTLTGTTFLNSGSASRFLGATDSGAMTITLTGTLTNQGAMHSSDAFTLNASSIENASTGGLSSLGDLHLNATAGNIHNDNNGAIYAAGNLSLTATGNIINDEDATIDGDGNFTASGTGLTSRFTNQGQITIGGNATINARNFENLMAGAENLVREWRGLNTNGSSINQHNYTTTNDTVPDVSTTSWYYDGHGGYSGDWFDDRESAVYGHFYRKEFFQGIADAETTFGDKTKPQISATNLTVSGFDTGRNVGGLMTATDTLTISGASGSSTFLNDSMALGLEKWNYQATWWYEYTTGSYDWWNPTGGNHITNRLTTLDSAQSYFSIGAGIRAGTLIVTNVGALTNMGSPNEPLGATFEDIEKGEPGRPTAAAAGTGLSDTNEETTAGLSSVDAVSFKSRSTVVGAATSKAATLLSAGNLKAGSAGASNSLKGSDEAAGGPADHFSSRNAAAFANALKNAKISLNGLSLKLPSNPNGYFVPNADPTAKYLVNVNDTFGIDPGSAVGSDELFKQLGADPDNVQKRLGDAAYETYLVRQQLVDQLGTKFLAGQKSEADQMTSLMTNAATEARRLGLQVGVAPSAAQLANLTEDMVWMVEQEVAGERVLVPQVYLSSKTRGLFDADTATLAGDKVEMDVGSLANTGGTISGSDSLSIKAKDDITNLSGNISGGDVSLKAGGSIINETTTRGNADSTVVGRTAGITATGDLDLDAGKDIKIIGGDVKAAGDASIAAGGEIVVDTVQKKTTTRTTEASSGFIGSSKTTTTTVDVENQASNLDFGGNVKIKSGGDTTIAGSNLNVGGNLDADVGGNLNVLARQDQHTVNTESSTSGVGVGGGIYGSQTTTTNDFTGTNVGSSIKVGGDANIAAAKTLTLEGSDLDVQGGGSLSANDILVLDGKDERRTTTTTTTTTFGIFSDAGGSAGAEASASGYGRSASASASTEADEDGNKSRSGTERGHASLSGNASAGASAEGSAGTTIGVRTNTTTTDDYESKSRASTIKFGGDLKIEAKENLITRGSDIEAGGNVDLQAKDMLFLAGQDLKTSTTSSETTTAGLNFSAEGSASASANANVGPMAAGANAEAEAGAEVGVGIMVQNNKSKSSEGSSTARVSTIKSGGNLTRTATNGILDVGTDIEVGGDLNQEAKTITSLAAANTSWSSEESTTHTGKIGLYADAKASGSAEASASTNVGGGMNGKASAEGSAEVTAGIKAQYTFETTSASEQSSEAVVSNIKVGGNVSSKSSGKTTLEGTNIEAGGDVSLEAQSLDYRAAQNTSSSSSSEANAETTLQLGVGAGASASSDGDASAGYGLQGSLAASGGKSDSSERSSEAVTGSLVAGGKLTIKTKDDARFEGTNLESGGDAKIQAGGNVTFDAARNTSESSADSFNVSAELGGNTYGGSKSVKGGVEGGYSNEKSSSSEAVTGSLKSGGNLAIEAGGNATFEGTDIAANGEASIDAKGNVDFKQATSTSSSTSFEVSASLGFGAEKGGDGGSSNEFEAGVEGGYATESEKTAKTSTISTGSGLTIKSGKDTTLQGTNIESGGDTTIAAGGNLNLTAKEESSSSFGVSGGIGIGGGSESGGGESKTSKEMSAEIAIEGQSDVSREGGTIKSGGAVNLSSGKNTTLVGTQVEAAGDVNVVAGGTVTQKKAESSSIGGSIGLAVSHESESSSPSGGAAGGTGTGGTGTTGGTDAKSGAADTTAGGTDKKNDGAKPSAGLTDLGFNAGGSSQSTSLKSGSGKVNVQQNAKPAPAAEHPTATK